MVKYDPKILQRYAELLYSSARSTIFAATVTGALTGIFPGVFVGRAIAVAIVRSADQLIVTVLLAVVIGFIFAAGGFWIGQRIAFWYRLKAELTLCQKQIEYNTRIVAVRGQESQLQQIGP